MLNLTLQISSFHSIQEEPSSSSSSSSFSSSSSSNYNNQNLKQLKTSFQQTSVISSFDVESLTDDQLECLCLTLENFENFRGLKFLLNLFPSTFFEQKKLIKNSLIRAKALILFHESKYEEFKEFIRLNQFKQQDHHLFQNLWNEANYAEASKQRNKPLDAVSRYRIRKKNIFPSSIWDGEGTSYCFKKKAREILRQFYKIDQVPDISKKQELSKLTELSVLQVSNWFKNQRQRARQNQRNKRKFLKTKRIFNELLLEEEVEEGEEVEEEECICNNNNNIDDYAESEGRQSIENNNNNYFN